MQKTFTQGKYKIDVVGTCDPTTHAVDRVRADIVIANASTGEVLSTLRRYFGSVTGDITEEDAIAFGYREACEHIRSGLVRK